MADTIKTGASGRFLLRIEPGLHELLRSQAEAAGLSLNEYCARKLALPVDPADPAGEVVGRAAAVAGGALLGVVAFGSWARGEATAESDVDVMVVVADDLGVDRGLYRAWDEEPVRWEGRRVEPHFAHLPSPAQQVSGLWAEIAIDGFVLSDRDQVVSRWLGTVRRRIAAGEVERRVAHGQPYWVATG